MRKKKLLMTLGSVCLALMLAVPIVAGCAAPAPTPTPTAEVWRGLVGTTGSVSSWYVYWVAAADTINKHAPGVELTISVTGGSNENLERLAAGDFHIILNSDSAYYPAYHGLGRWEGKPVTNLRQLWYYFTTPMCIVVSEESGITSIYELSGKKFCPGAKGSASETIMDNAFEVLGIEVDAYRGSYADHMAAFKDRVIVGYQKPAVAPSIPDATTLEAMAFMDIRVLGFSQADFDKIKEVYPYYAGVPVAAGTYDFEWNREPVPCLGLVGGAGCDVDIPEEVAYNIVKAIWENRGTTDVASPASKDAMPEMVPKVIATPLHPGAIRYYREIGVEIPEHLIPPEMK